MGVRPLSFDRSRFVYYFPPFPCLSLSIEGEEGGGKRHANVRVPIKLGFCAQHLVRTNSGAPERHIYHFCCALVYFHYEPVFTASAQH